jgi:copper oxidase (laccase) domain-containing protein
MSTLTDDNRQVPFQRWPLSRGFFSTYSRPPTLAFYHVQQVHGPRCVRLTPERSPALLEEKADGVFFLYEDWKGRPLPAIAVKTADCLPICLVGKKGIAMVHAGWRGIEQRAWREASSVDPTSIFIGPHICVDHYPVGDEFLDIFQQSKALGHRHGKLHFNLGQEAISRLEADFPGCSIASAQICTFEQSALHSFRRQPGTGSLYHLWQEHVTL